MEIANMNLSALKDDFSRGQVCDCLLPLSLGDFNIRICSNSQPLLDELNRYFSSFVGSSLSEPEMTVYAVQRVPPSIPLPLQIKTPDPGKSKIKEEFADLPGGRIVRKRLTGMVFLFGEGINLAVGDCEANANQIINFVNNRYIQHQLDRGFLLGHASAVCGSNAGMAFAGLSGAGKSTLALHVMNFGFKFVSNDRLLVKSQSDGLLMSGVAKMPRINPGTMLHNRRLRSLIPEDRRATWEALPVESLRGLEEKYDVMVEELYGAGTFRLFCPMNALVILTWTPTGGSAKIDKINLKDRPDLLRAFIKSPGLFYQPEIPDPDSAFSEEAYLRLLAGCEVYEISGGANFEEAARQCAAILHDLDSNRVRR